MQIADLIATGSARSASAAPDDSALLVALHARGDDILADRQPVARPVGHKGAGAGYAGDEAGAIALDDETF